MTSSSRTFISLIALTSACSSNKETASKTADEARKSVANESPAQPPPPPTAGLPAGWKRVDLARLPVTDNRNPGDKLQAPPAWKGALALPGSATAECHVETVRGPDQLAEEYLTINLGPHSIEVSMLTDRSAADAAYAREHWKAIHSPAPTVAEDLPGGGFIAAGPTGGGEYQLWCERGQVALHSQTLAKQEIDVAKTICASIESTKTVTSPTVDNNSARKPTADEVARCSQLYVMSRSCGYRTDPEHGWVKTSVTHPTEANARAACDVAQIATENGPAMPVPRYDANVVAKLDTAFKKGCPSFKKELETVGPVTDRL